MDTDNLDLAHISANRRHRQDAGSCNACSGQKFYQVVTEITLRTLTFRLCDECRKELKRKLRN